MEYEDYMRLFQMIDAAFWAIAVARKKDGWVVSLADRLRKIEDAKKILTAYIDTSANRTQKLLTDESFSRFPLPTRKGQG